MRSAAANDSQRKNRCHWSAEIAARQMNDPADLLASKRFSVATRHRATGGLFRDTLTGR
ncbi:hypothetical protein PSP6_380022 [Paraburkholderia tropica]|nr:hypothetical protein PSP6_380022 [Paraburkholderia tropica]